MKVKSVLIKAAADLLAANWLSSDPEDLPPRTPKRLIRAIAADQERRRLMAIELRKAYDELCEVRE